MSRRGRARGGRYNSDKSSAYPYQGDRYSQHDDRSGRTGADKERGDYSSYSRDFGNYDIRGGRGGGKFRGQSRRPRYFRGGNRGRGRPYGERNSSRQDKHTDGDGDVNMDGSGRTVQRMAPYSKYGRGTSRPPNNRHPHHKRQNQWSLITVFDAATLDQAWLIDAIQRESMTQILPVQYYCDEKHASFCIENSEVAAAIRDCNKKIEAPDGSKLGISKRPCDAPIKDEKIPILKEVLSQRYNAQECHLNASDLFRDEKLRENGIVLKPRNPREMYIIVRLIGEHIPGLLSLDLSENRLDSLAHLKRLVMFTPKLQRLKLVKNSLSHADILEDIKDWDLKELNIDDNPLCAKYQSVTDYVSAVRDRFPNLETLDGKKLPPPVKFDLEKVTKLVPAIPYHLPQEVSTLITQFVQQYFSLYDTDRSSLNAAYDEQAIFSLCIPTSVQGHPLSKYYNFNRNLSRLKNSGKRISYLRYPRSEVCSTLCQLPSTEHNITGFSVDVPLISSHLLKFVIRGLFKEKTSSGSSNDIMRAFSRSFLCLTDGVRLSIINDELHIRNASHTERKSAFVKPPVTPSPSPVPEHPTPSPAPPGAIASPSKMEIIAAFSRESGMNAKFSEQCLAESQWDYAKAGQAFLAAKEKGMIPPEAFVR